MFKHGNISTEVDRNTFIFTFISAIISTIVAMALLFVRNNILVIPFSILLTILALASYITLFGLISDYAYIENDNLYMHYLFKSSSIGINEIKNIKLKDNVYHVYNKTDDEVGNINALAIGIDKILDELIANNVSFS